MNNSASLWAITARDVPSLIDRFRQAMGDEHARPKVSLGAVMRAGSRLSADSYATLRGETAIIPVLGPLMNRNSYCCFTYDDIRRDIDTALGDERVARIMLDIESPGGMASGCDELANYIRRAAGVKPIAAHISTMGASAAYFLAAAAPFVTAAPISMVGSVGVVFEYIDLGGVAENFGAKRVTVVASQSPNKRPAPGSEEEKAQLQPIADRTADIFLKAVAKFRGKTPEEALSSFGGGAIMTSQAAKSAGMIDAVMPFDVALARFETASAPASGARASLALRPAGAAGGFELDPDRAEQVKDWLANGETTSAAQQSAHIEVQNHEIVAPATAAHPESGGDAGEEAAAPETPASSPAEAAPAAPFIITQKETVTVSDTTEGLRAQLKKLTLDKANIMKSVDDPVNMSTQTDREIKDLDAAIDKTRHALERQVRLDQDLAYISQPNDVKTAGASASPQTMGDRPRGEQMAGIKFASFGDAAKQLYEHVLGNRPSTAYQMMMASGYVGSDGGFIMPEAQSMEVVQAIFAQDSIRGRCDTKRISEKSISYPVRHEASWDPNKKGIKAESVGENQGATASKPNFRMTRVELFKKQAIVEVPKELVKFADVLEGFILDEARDQIEWEDSYDLVWGDGMLKSSGWANSDALVTVAAESGQSADTIVAENIAKMDAALLHDTEDAFWLCSPSAYPQVTLLSTKATTEQLFIAQGKAADKPGKTLLGRPIVKHQVAKELGAVGDIMLVNPKRGMFAPEHETGVEIEISPHAEFKTDKVVYKITFFGGGQTKHASPVPSRHGSFPMSDFIALAAR